MERDRDLEFYAKKIREADEARADIALRLELNSAMTSLRGHPGWESIVDRLRTIEARETERLRYSEMTPYELGKRQGRLIAMGTITAGTPLTEADIDELRERDKVLVETIAVNRNLLN
jgi:hypothetical protein